MKKTSIIICLLSVALVIALVCCYYRSVEKTGYVEISKLFEEFKLKKELAAQLQQIKSTRKNITDSLEFELKAIAKQIQVEGQKDKLRINEFELKRERYFEKKKQFEDDNIAVGKQFDTQIIAQLNQYVKDYGDKHGYTYIFGADGSGFLMFSLEKKNITEEVKIYINERYKGKTE
jgi:outer membrane protein